MSESWWHSGLIVLVLCGAFAVGAGLQSWSLEHASTVPPTNTAIASGNPAAMAAVPATCPAQSSAIANKAFRPAVGDGPVYMTLGPRPLVGQQVLNSYPSVSREDFPDGWGGEMVSFLVAPSYQLPITMSGSGFGTTAELKVIGPPILIPYPSSFGDRGWPVTSVTTDGWRNYAVPISIRLDASGCYQLDLSGPGLAEQIVFWAEVGTRPGAAVPSAPSATPTPPACPWGNAIVDWVPFLRLDGRSYLVNGMGWFAAGPQPPLSVDPAFAGRQVGTVLWDVEAPATNPCYSLLDGSSSVLEAGTPVFAFNGYKESFRLVAETPDGWRVFEADGIAGAKFVGDLLDIKGRVVSVVAEREEQSGGRTVLARITDAGAISTFMDFILGQGIDLAGGATPPSDSAQRVLLTFWLSDGTATARRFYVGGQTSQGIPIGRDVFTQLEAYLEAAR